MLAIRAGAEGFGWDASVRAAVSDLFPVSSSDVHVDPIMQGVTLVVGGLTALAGLWLLVRRRYRAALFLAGAIGGAVLLSTVVKTLVERPPIEGAADDYSFPSGSAAWSMASALAVALLARSRREVLALAAAGAVLVLGLGAVIVWEEWHYPSDVVAGWSLALGWVAVLWLALRRPSAPR